MKATGIVRRIDDLGRVVIPKEIRRTLRMREGDPLEIYTDTNGEVIFKKYSPMGDLENFISQYTEVLYKAIGMPVIITDRDSVAACMGIPKKDVINKRVTQELEDIMERRSTYILKPDSKGICPAEGLDRNAALAVPIIGSGDVSGCIVVLYDNVTGYPSEAAVKLCEVGAQFLGKQTED